MADISQKYATFPFNAQVSCWCENKSHMPSVFLECFLALPHRAFCSFSGSWESLGSRTFWKLLDIFSGSAFWPFGISERGGNIRGSWTLDIGILEPSIPYSFPCQPAIFSKLRRSQDNSMWRCEQDAGISQEKSLFKPQGTVLTQTVRTV